MKTFYWCTLWFVILGTVYMALALGLRISEGDVFGTTFQFGMALWSSDNLAKTLQMRRELKEMQ